MDFTGFPEGTHLDEQYLDEFGVRFVDETNFVIGPSRQLFPNDSWGLRIGSFAEYAEFTLEAPVTSVAFEFPGSIAVTLWLGDELVGETGHARPGSGHFFGVISDLPFDRVRIDDGADTASLDDIRIGMAIPGPAVAWMLAIPALGSRRVRRR